MRRLVALALLAPAAAWAGWDEVLPAVLPAVVVIKTDRAFDFDTDGQSGSQATGFVVDAARGIVLTNRHVHGVGPVRARATFQDGEEVWLRPLWADPLHDFAFFRFDPKEVEHQAVIALPLDPAGARVGIETRVVGNDAGEKLAILEGTLARLDRDAPRYGRGKYNDWNTFYLQAASSTSGGSSGSPVLDARGHVVALNAGTRRDAAASFFLPLDRVVRALALLQAEQPVPRGTLGLVLQHRSWQELKDLGSGDGARSGAGRLAVDRVLPGLPADGALRVGDVVRAVDGVDTPDFVAWEAALDARVGQEAAITVDRRGTPVTVSLRVADLAATVPSSFLSVGDAVLHAPSLQQVADWNLRPQGLVLASRGDLFARVDVPSGAVIEALGGQPTPTVEAAEAVLAALPHGAPLRVRWFDPQAPQRHVEAVASMDRTWYPADRWQRRGDRWVRTAIADAQGAVPTTPLAVPPVPARGVAGRVAPSLVQVSTWVPIRVDGVASRSFRGTGLIVDAAAGLVLVDRDTVPGLLAEPRITVAGAVELAASVRWVHPEHGFAFLRVDPAALARLGARSAVLADAPLAPGDDVTLVGLLADGQPTTVQTAVARRWLVDLPMPSPPRFRERNVDALTLVEPGPLGDGVLVDRRGRVLALYASVSFEGEGGDTATHLGLPSALFAPLVPRLAAGEDPVIATIGFEVASLPLPEAIARGLPAAEAELLAAAGGAWRRALVVQRRSRDAAAWTALQDGDLLLRADGGAVVGPATLEAAAADGSMQLDLLRDGAVRTVTVAAWRQGGRTTDRVLVSSGAAFTATPKEVSDQRGEPLGGVTIALWWQGSPAARGGLRAQHRVVSIDGQAVPDLEALAAHLAGHRDRTAARFELEDPQGRTLLRTVVLDAETWPTVELRWGKGGWRRVAR